MEESISKAAGADAGEYLPESEICALIRAAGRIPVQRTTTYGRIAAAGVPRSGSRCWLAEWEQRAFCGGCARFLIRRG